MNHAASSQIVLLEEQEIWDITLFLSDLFSLISESPIAIVYLFLKDHQDIKFIKDSMKPAPAIGSSTVARTSFSKQ